MNTKRIRKLFGCLALLFLLLSPVAQTGCKTSVAGVGLKTAQGVNITVTVALTAWGDYVAKFHPPVEQEQQVFNALQKYKAAQLVVVDALQFYNAVSATNAPGGQSAVDLAMANASVALLDLINLMRQFGAKI